MSWANTCYEKIGNFIKKYASEVNLPEEWVAGIISVECSSLNPLASRFEPAVFKSVQTVKQGKKSTAYPGFNYGKIRSFIDSTDDETTLKMLATSYGVGQLMGYHYVNKYDFTATTRPNFNTLSLELSVLYLIRFMADGYKLIKVDGSQSDMEFERLLRWHNTGSATGKTYHDNYVKNAIKMKDEYLKVISLNESNKFLKDLKQKPSDSSYELILNRINELEERLEKLETIIHE